MTFVMYRIWVDTRRTLSMGRIKKTKASRTASHTASNESQGLPSVKTDAPLILEYTRNIRALFKRVGFPTTVGEEWEDLAMLTEDVFKDEPNVFMRFADHGLFKHIQEVFNDSRIHVLDLNLKTREMEEGTEIVPRLHDEYYMTKVGNLSTGWSRRSSI